MSDSGHRRPLGAAGYVTLACLWEATAAKPGNVYRGADFGDMTYADFVTSAAAIGPVFECATDQSVGRLALEAVQAMRSAAGINTHLGTILLLAPLAKAASCPGELFENASVVVAATSVEDAQLAFESIRLAAPSGLGETSEADVSQQPKVTLHHAMSLAAERDLVARQYDNGFQEVRAIAAHIERLAASGRPMANAIVDAHVHQMAACPDSLIERKCGSKVAQESAARAARVLAARDAGSESYGQALADLDFWLRADGHRRNPGTTADLIGAALFCLLTQDRLCWPIRFYGDPT
ncbi:triphosphoribosyl-dephospho-CoA synthase [Posidoniimonas corsicana]|uniref:Triphosphoribosyl-dephospho-CoA synthase n=1 Tax=Posidoniimonas corsicana TaxID=1938618 RepID=A0A5C5VHG3_9BACT|nr:triphosphoribosyl-dephospho-CoA synthase [Posidoniimonas corsicana]TWT38064.1 triphosphoribosyl-dephospho-CoA synthase [Posidoniimonas corsicana]